MGFLPYEEPVVQSSPEMQRGDHGAPRLSHTQCPMAAPGPPTRLKRQNEGCLHLRVIHGGLLEAVGKGFQSAFQTLPSSLLSLNILLHLLSFVENDTGFFHW